jgi:O-antigen ligase
MFDINKIKLDKVILSIMLMIFISSLIIYDLESNVIYSNLINLVFWGVFTPIFIFSNKNKLPKNPIFTRYLIFSIFSFLSILWANDINLALSFTSRLIVIIINIYVLFILLNEYNLRQIFLIGIIIGAIFNYLLAFNILIVSYDTYEFGRFLGSVGNPNKLSKIMILSIFASSMLLVIKDRKFIVKLILSLNILLAFYVIIMTASKQAIILAPIFIIFSFRIMDLKIKKIFLYTFLIFCLYHISIRYLAVENILSNYEHLVYRMNIFKETLKGSGMGISTINRRLLIYEGLDMFEKNPILGIGMNNFRFLNGSYAHNNYLELLVGVGLVGTFIFYSIYFIIFKKVNAMHSLKIKRILYSMILIILFLDLVTVTYLDKLLIFTLLFIYSFPEGYKKVKL